MEKPGFTIVCLILMISMACVAHAQIITETNSLEFYETHMHLLKEETTVLIDGRSSEMFDEGHIEGAIMIDAFKEGFLPELSSFAGRSTIVVYCTTVRRTNVLIDALKTFYTGHIFCICDGITGWKQNNLPIVK